MPDIPSVLVVDDDPGICKYLKDILSRKHYKIVIANCGREAIKNVNQTAYDLVFIDLSLPDMEGYQVIDHINEKSPESLVIIITGHASVESVIKVLRKGAHDYIKKPFKHEEMLKTIENALNFKILKDRRKESEIALKESEELFRSLVEKSLIGICIIHNNKIVYQNTEQNSLLGNLSDSFEITDFKYVHPDDIDKIKRSYESILSGKVQTVQLDFRVSPTGKFGSRTDIRWLQCRANAFSYLGEKAVLFNTIDITRAKELESLVIVKHKMSSLGRVAAGIAHEIRNPLTGINTYLYTLEGICRADKFESDNIQMIKKIAGQIQVASNKIESVIKRVLDFSKPSTPEMSKMNLNQSILEAINLSAATLRKNGIKTVTFLSENLPNCYGDSHLIEQVILNLINNATKAMNKEDDTNIIKITSYSENQIIFISVGDSGPGVPLNMKDKIFDPFFTTHSDGSGIGLSLAQRIIADHGGTISVGASELGGAEFTIELPVEKRITSR